MKNPVLETTRFLIEEPRYIEIDMEKIKEIAEKYSKENLIVPKWDAPVFPEERNQETIDFFMTGNSVNFCYNNKGVKYSTNYKDYEWKGAFGMWASFKKAVENRIPILDGKFLREITEEKVEKIFRGNSPMPMIKERTEILREVEKVLCEKYDGHFHNLAKESRGRLFKEGDGIVERLAEDFCSFDDSAEYEGNFVVFNKRAQLAPGMLIGKFENKGLFKVKDVDELTVFADYSLPASLRDLGILRYEKSLVDKIDKKIKIRSNSLEELEIRASTIHASKMLQDEINKKKSQKINALHIDYKLWMEQRNKNLPQHFTMTTNY